MDGQRGKEYRLPTDVEVSPAEVNDETLAQLFGEVPYGLPDGPTPSEDALDMRVPRCGFDTFARVALPMM